MKTLKNLKLNHLSRSELKQKELNYLMGGQSCACTCSGDPTNTDLVTNISWQLHEKCTGQCGCVCGGEDAQNNCDRTFFLVEASPY